MVSSARDEAWDEGRQTGVCPLTVEVDPLFHKAVGDAGRDGNPKHFVLERLDHQHNPEHEADELKQRMEAKP